MDSKRVLAVVLAASFSGSSASAVADGRLGTGFGTTLRTIDCGGGMGVTVPESTYQAVSFAFNLVPFGGWFTPGGVDALFCSVLELHPLPIFGEADVVDPAVAVAELAPAPDSPELAPAIVALPPPGDAPL